MKGYGIRIDSGDLAYLSKKAYQMLEAEGFVDAIISASSDLDEYLIDSLKTQGAKINSWGVGTNLITSGDWPAFGGVYKLAAAKDKDDAEFTPKIKLSENSEKVTNPGNKTIYRIYDKETGKIRADLICLADETFRREQRYDHLRPDRDLEKDEDQRRNLHLTRAPRSDFPEGRMRLHFSIRYGDPRHLHQRERYPLGGVQTSGQSA